MYTRKKERRKRPEVCHIMHISFKEVQTNQIKQIILTVTGEFSYHKWQEKAKFITSLIFCEIKIYLYLLCYQYKKKK